MGFKPKQKHADCKTTYPIFQAGLRQPQAERLHSIEKIKSNLVLISKASKAQFLPQTEDLWVSLYQFL